MDVSDEMTRATKLGGKVGQASGFFSLLGYCLRSKKIARKLVFGFLYIYWTNHFFTLGSYFGALVKIPGLYKKVGEYYVTHNDSENYFERLNEFMDKD